MEKYERKNEILLDGTEQCLTIRGYYAYFENCGSNTVYISKNTGIIPNSDGVMQLCPGESGEYALPIDGRIYVKGTGCVSVTGSDCPRTVKCNGENLLINPDFRINQRGAKGVIGSAGYFVDRWKLLEGTVTINQDHSITLNGKIAQQLENPPEGQLCPSVSAGSLAYYDRNSGTFYIESNGGTIKWAKLEHGSELMLTWVTAKTVAGQIPDLPIYTLKFQLIDLGAFHDCSTLGAIEADVSHTALHVVVMTAFSNIMADFHGREVIQLKAGIIIAGYIDIFLFIRSLEPGDDLGIWQRCGIEGDEMRSGEEKLTIDLRISDADHTLVIGQLDLEVVSDIYHTATQPFELPLMLPMDKSRGFSVH